MEDLKQLLHALGLGLSYRTVKELSTFATDLRRSERVYYRVCTPAAVSLHHSCAGLGAHLAAQCACVTLCIMQDLTDTKIEEKTPAPAAAATEEAK